MKEKTLEEKIKRLKTEIEAVHAKLWTDVKTFGEEVLSDIQKKHDLWEQKVENEHLPAFSPHQPADSTSGPFFFALHPSLLSYLHSHQGNSIGNLTSRVRGDLLETSLSTLILGLPTECSKFKPYQEVSLQVTLPPKRKVPLCLFDLREHLRVVVTRRREGSSEGEDVTLSRALETEPSSPDHLVFSFVPQRDGAFTVCVLANGRHVQGSPLLVPVLREDKYRSLLTEIGLERIEPGEESSQRKSHDSEGGEIESVLPEAAVNSSDAKIEDLKALMDRELTLENRYRPPASPLALLTDSGRTQQMVVEYELQRRLESLGLEKLSPQKEDVKRLERFTEQLTSADSVDGIEGIKDKVKSGDVVVKKVTPMKKPDQVLYQPPFSRQTNLGGVGRGRGQLYRRDHQRVEDLMARCSDIPRQAGRGKCLKKTKKRRQECEEMSEEQAPRVESIKYQDVQQGVKREKMMRKSPMKEMLDGHQLVPPQPLQHQAAPAQGSGDVKNDSRVKQAKNFLSKVSENQDGHQEENFKEQQTQAASILHPEIHQRVFLREARRDEIHQRVSCPKAADGDEVRVERMSPEKEGPEHVGARSRFHKSGHHPDKWLLLDDQWQHLSHKSNQQIVPYYQSSEVAKNERSRANPRQEKSKKAQNERSERDEYWRKLKQEEKAVGRRGGARLLERGSAEEARQAGARSGRHLHKTDLRHQLNAQRTARRIEDLKVQLAVISDLEKNLASNGSIDAKSREEIGKKEEYIVELRRLENGKLY